MCTSLRGDLGERVDRHIDALEVVSPIKGCDEGGHDRVVRDAESSTQPAGVVTRREQLSVDAVWHLDQLLRLLALKPCQVGNRRGVVGRQHAHAIGGADQRRRDGVLVGLEQPAANTAADEPVLVVDEQRLAASLASQAGKQRQLRAEDERVVDVDDVEARDPRQRWDQRRVADGEDRVEPVDVDSAGVGNRSGGGRGEDLDVVAAIGLLASEAKRGVAGASGIGREGRREMRDPQRAGRPRGGGANRRCRPAARRRSARSSSAARP